MKRYRKKPVVIEAVRIDSADYDGMCEIVAWCGGIAVSPEATEHMDGSHVIAVDTLEGRMYADPGDWIIRGVKGEFYPCKPDIFDATYERADEPATAPSECPECGGTGARGCGAAWHDGKPDAPSPLDEPTELIDVAASHSRWLRHNGYVQPADCMDRLCELLVLVTGRLTGEPTAAPTRPTREQVREAITRPLQLGNTSQAGEDEAATNRVMALLAGEGTAQPEPKVHRWTDGDGNEWECSAYDHGPFCRLCKNLGRASGEGTAPPPADPEWEVYRGYGVRHKDGARAWCYTAGQEQHPRLAHLMAAMLNAQIPGGTAPQPPAEVLWEGPLGVLSRAWQGYGNGGSDRPERRVRVVAADGAPQMALTNADVANLSRNVCEECRKGHYSLPGGKVTGYPCVTDGCGCSYCHVADGAPQEASDG